MLRLHCLWLDAEWVFIVNRPEVAVMPRQYSQREYIWNALTKLSAV